MARVVRGFKARRRRKKILKLAKGFRGARNNCFGTAIHVVRRSLVFSYRDRRARKRDFRTLWIARINAASRACGLKYSEFIDGLNKSGIEIDRSVLADLAIHDQDGFVQLVEEARSALKK